MNYAMNKEYSLNVTIANMGHPKLSFLVISILKNIFLR